MGLRVQLDHPEASLELDIGSLGVRSIELTEPCALSARAARDTLALVRLLREAVTHGASVDWVGRVEPGVEVGLLVHLPPPAARPDDGADDWRERHAPGLCYYRVGPDFVQVKDVRRPEARSRFRFDGANAAFAALEGVVHVGQLEPETQVLLDALEQERLVLRLGDLCTLLPHRMRRWPVPAMEV